MNPLLNPAELCRRIELAMEDQRHYQTRPEEQARVAAVQFLRSPRAELRKDLNEFIGRYGIAVLAATTEGRCVLRWYLDLCEEMCGCEVGV